MAWTNWAGNQSCAARVATPASEDEVDCRGRGARSPNGTGLRPAGAGHSFTPIVATDGAVLELGACAASSTSTSRGAA